MELGDDEEEPAPKDLDVQWGNGEPARDDEREDLDAARRKRVRTSSGE